MTPRKPPGVGPEWRRSCGSLSGGRECSGLWGGPGTAGVADRDPREGRSGSALRSPPAGASVFRRQSRVDALRL